MADEDVESKVAKMNDPGVQAMGVNANEELKKEINDLREMLKLRNLCLAILSLLLVTAIVGIVVLNVVLHDERAKETVNISDIPDCPSESPTNSPTNMPIRAPWPTPTLLYDPPSPEQCAKIAAGEEIDNQAALILATPPKGFDIKMDVTMNLEVNPSLWIADLAEKLQQVLAPELTDCGGASVRGGGRSLQVERFVIRNAIIDAEHDINETCLNNNDSGFCYRVLVNLILILEAPEATLKLVNRISVLFGEGYLVADLGLDSSFKEIEVVGVTNTPVSFPTPSPVQRLR